MRTDYEIETGSHDIVIDSSRTLFVRKAEFNADELRRQNG